MEQKMIDTAKVVMADTFKFYLLAHNYHWNVEGPDFSQYHQLFSGIYNEAWTALDTIAEEIRAMGAYVPGSCGRFNELSDIEDEREVPDAKTMILRLYQQNQLLLANLMPAYHAAEEAMNHGFSNLLAERMSAHKKHGWMLKASLKD